MATEDRGPADRRRPKALSVDEWRELDKTLQTLVLTVAKKAKNPTFSPDQLAQWIIGRLQVLLRRQLDLGSIADALGKISVMWACRFCNVSREDDTITALVGTRGIDRLPSSNRFEGVLYCFQCGVLFFRSTTCSHRIATAFIFYSS